MTKICAVFGSPRRNGNTAMLLRRAIDGAKESGAEVEEIVLRDKKISPCLEIYGCRKTGQCVIKDDFQSTIEQILEADGLILASPIFFYSVSAHTKILIDRCQSLWMKKYRLKNSEKEQKTVRRKGLFISLGATNGKKLFDGALLTVKYFFDVMDMDVHETLLYRGVDNEGEVLEYPDYLNNAYRAGQDLVKVIRENK